MFIYLFHILLCCNFSLSVLCLALLSYILIGQMSDPSFGVFQSLLLNKCIFILWGSNSLWLLLSGSGNLSVSKQKFLFWLLLKDRLNTGIFFGAKFLILRVLSVLCSGHERESLKHMFFVCPFCQRCWRGIGINWDLDLSVIDLIQAGKVTSLLSCFREIVIIVCWKIWKLRSSGTTLFLTREWCGYQFGRERLEKFLLWLSIGSNLLFRRILQFDREILVNFCLLLHVNSSFFFFLVYYSLL